MAIIDEWIYRGYKDTCRDRIITIWQSYVVSNWNGINTHAHWLGNDIFHASHRSNLLRKMPEYYSEFGWKEPDNLPYYWPVQILVR